MTRINNENLANYVMFKLNKLVNDFSEDELNQIEEIIINYDDEEQSSFIFLEELLKFNKLRSLTLRNGYIYNDNYNIFTKLNNLEDITFEKCEFENKNYITKLNLKSLSFYNCKISDYSFVNSLTNLEELSIVNGNIDMDVINTLTNLVYLEISNSNIKGIIKSDKIKELHIDYTDIENFDFLNNINSLERLSIDIKQYNSNKELFDNLSKKSVLVLNENMVEFGGNTNEI